MSASIWCVIPVKAFDRAKSRLAGRLSDVERVRFARETFVRVHDACQGHPSVAGVVVATDAAGVRDLVDPTRTQWIADGSDPRLGAILDRALAHVASLGGTRALVLMSDLPRITTADVAALIDALGDGTVVTAPDRRREGTNALGLCMPAPLATCFGRRDSFRAHLAAIEAARLRPTVIERDGLAFDVDGPDDYAELSRP